MRWKCDLTYIILGEEVEGTEYLVVVELEALGGLEHTKIVGLCGWLWQLFLGAPLRLVLAVSVLRVHSRSSAAATVMALRVGLMRRGGRGVVRHSVVIASHDGFEVWDTFGGLLCDDVEPGAEQPNGEKHKASITTKGRGRELGKVSVDRGM
jgi:hypothetical protein